MNFQTDSNESAFQKNRFRNADGKSHYKKSKAQRNFEKAIDEGGTFADPTGTLSAISAFRKPKGKERRKAFGNLALNILFPFAPIMRAIKKRRKHKGKHPRKHNPTPARSVQVYDNGMIADEHNQY